MKLRQAHKLKDVTDIIYGDTASSARLYESYVVAVDMLEEEIKWYFSPEQNLPVGNSVLATLLGSLRQGLDNIITITSKYPDMHTKDMNASVAIRKIAGLETLWPYTSLH
jgi:hypothetical protein